MSRFEERVRSTRFRASMIFPSGPRRMTLLYWAMISMAMVSVSLSPSSLVAEKSRKRMRSKPACRMPVSVAPPRRLRSSMQSMGGVAGFSNVAFVRWMRGLLARAQSSSLSAPRSRERSVSTSSSEEGW